MIMKTQLQDFRLAYYCMCIVCGTSAIESFGNIATDALSPPASIVKTYGTTRCWHHHLP